MFPPLNSKMPTGETAGVLCLLNYSNVAQLDALAKLRDRDEGIDHRVLLL